MRRTTVAGGGPVSAAASRPGAAPSSLARRPGRRAGPVRSTDRAALRNRPWTRCGRAHPQLLHHQPRGPRQVDPLGPHPRDHRRGGPAPHAGAVPRLHGHRARAWHHHQGAERPRRARRPHPPPHRHARSRRLRLRGLPLAGRVRGGGAVGGRDTRDPGPDAGQLLPGHRARPRDRAGPQQDRSPGRRSGPLRARDRTRARAARRGHLAHQRQDGGGGARAARRHHRPHPAAPRGRRRPAAGPDLRLLLRPVPRRGELHPDRRRHAADRGAAALHAGQRGARHRRGRRAHARHPARAAARARRGGVPDRRHQGRRRGPLG